VLRVDDGRLAAGARVLWSLPATIAIIKTDISFAWRCALVACLAGHLIFELMVRELLSTRSKGSVASVQAICQPDGAWLLIRGEGAPVKAQLIRSWGAGHGPVIGLCWRLDGGETHRAWIAKWVTPASTWRRLRTRLQLS
jgi:hypothetical protein